ncbi:MAG: sulfotransferase [Candidatus Omnitrophica bacterium]|nr:sulfotransferase [Candidatus Omnitrophota bacterium]
MVKPKIFVTGTMRTGSSLITNLLSVHSKISMVSDGVHFFRFIYKQYEPLNEKNVYRLLRHLRARLYHRFQIEFDYAAVFETIKKISFTHAVIYDEIMKYFLRQKKGKEIWGDDPALQWREIPDFIDMFPEGKVIHILRDPRAVLSSWKRGIGPGEFRYLHAMFNCLDCLHYAEEFKRTLSPKNYFPVRYEDIVADPSCWVGKLCDFLDIKFEEIMLQPERWKDVLSDHVLDLGRSSFDGTVVGFSPMRANRWKDVIEDWELCLIESFMGDVLVRHGYELTGKPRFRENLMEAFRIYAATGKGVNTYPIDPRDYRGWGVPQKDTSYTKWFSDTPEAQAYLKEIAEIEKTA